MSQVLRLTGVNYPSNVGTIIKDHAGLTDGTLLLMDFSIAACLASTSGDKAYENAVNLADAEYKTLTGATESLVFRGRSGQAASFTDFTAGKGLRLIDTGSNSGINVSRPSTSEARPAEFDAYLHAGGVTNNQPDLVFIIWFRDFGNWTSSRDLSYFAEFDENPDLYQLDYLHPDIYRGHATQLNLATTNQGLNQVAFTRDSLFLNGALLTDQIDPANHNNALNALSPANALHWRFFPSGVAASPAWALYRTLCEDTAASGRTPLAAVQEDYNYVIANSGFVSTV